MPDLDPLSELTSSKTSLDSLIAKHSERTGLDPELVRRLVSQESRGNRRAVSPKGAGGVMQLMPATAQGLGVKNVFNPDENIRGGTDYLRQQLDRFGDVNLALAAYNAGPGAVEKHRGVPPYRETQNYVKTIGSGYQGTGYAQDPLSELTQGKQKTTSDPLSEITQGAQEPKQEPLKTPKVTSSVKELDSGEELPNVGRETSPAPIEFKAGTVDRAPASINPVENIYNALSDDTQQPRGLVGLQSRKFQTPPSQELGDWVKIPSSAKAPTEDDVIRGYLSTLGPEYVALGDKFKSDTGQNILSLRHGENIKQNEDGSYSIRPSRGAVQFLNAYMKSPDEGIAEAERQRREYVQAENKAVQESKSQIERARRATEIEKQSPGYRGLFTGGAPVTQAAGTILGPLGGDLREGAAEMRAVGEQAEQEKPRKSLSTGEQLQYGAGALIPTVAKLVATKGFGAAQLPALGVLEGSTPQERLRGGLEGTAMQTALGPIPSQLGESLPSVARKTVAGTTLASIPTAQAIAQGEPVASAVIQNAPFALLPALEGKQSPERPTEIGIEKAPVVGVQGEATANIDQRLADREAKVQPTFLRDDQGIPVARVLNPDEAAQGEKIKIRPIHQSDTQARNESGQFVPTPTPTERLNTPLSREVPQRQTAVNPAQVPVEQAGATTSPLNATTPPPAEQNLEVEATGIPRSPESQVESARSAQDLTAQAAQSTPSTEATENALPSQPNRAQFLEDKLHEMGADNASITNTSPERLAAINDTREELAKLRTSVRGHVPKVEAKGIQVPAEARTYQERSNVSDVQSANDLIDKEGSDAALDRLREGRHEIPKAALGDVLMTRLRHEAEAAELKGDKSTAADRYLKASEAASLTVRGLTPHAQEVQAASIIGRLTPEGALMEGTRRLQSATGKKDAKLSPEQTQSVIEPARNGQDASKRIDDLQAQINDLKSQITTKPRQQSASVRQKVQPLTVKLDTLANEARARLEARKQNGGQGSQAGASAIPLDIADYTIIGAAKLAKGGINKAAWTADMLKEFGDEIKPHLDRIFKASMDRLNDEKKSARSESQVRSATKTLGEQASVDPVTLKKQVADLLQEKSEQQIKKRMAARDLQSAYRKIEKKKEALGTDDKIAEVLRSGKLSLGGYFRILGGMSSKQIIDTAAKIPSTVLDVAQSRLGAARTSSATPRAQLYAAEYMKGNVPKNVLAAVRGQPSEVQPHAYPSAFDNPITQATLAPMMPLYASKEALWRSYEYPRRQYEVASVLAKNDQLDGLIKRSEVPQRTNDYLKGRAEIEGRRNRRYVDSFANQAADYELTRKDITPSAKDLRIKELKESPRELINSLASQSADKQVYANPLVGREAQIAQGMRKVASLGGTSKASEAAIFPFVTRPANALRDFLYTYTGARIPVEAVRNTFGRGWGTAERASFNEAVGRGGIPYVMFALGAALNQRGMLTSVDDGKSKNLKRATGYQDGALKVGNRYYQIKNIPVVGNLLALGATWNEKGAKALPNAAWQIVKEHPFLRTLTDISQSIEGVGQKGIARSGEEFAGRTASSLVPAPLQAAGSLSDTKERDISKEPFVGAIQEKTPLRRMLPAKQTVFGEDQNKSRLQWFDPFRSSDSKPSTGTREAIRLGIDVGMPHVEKETRYRPAETQEQFEQRRKAEGQAIKQSLDTFVPDAKYNGLSDKQKAEYLETLIREARAEASPPAKLTLDQRREQYRNKVESMRRRMQRRATQ